MIAGATVMVLLASPALARAQMVVTIAGDGQYHDPGCAVVRSAPKGVAVTSQGEAVARGLKPHAACHTPPREARVPDANAAIVYVEPAGTKYHRKGCRALGSKGEAVALGRAGRKYWPCGICRPPIRKKNP